MKKIISCNIHDYFEIACMRKSTITLTLHDGNIIKGQAVDLITKNKSEFICLTSNSSNDKQENKRINLLDIHTLEIDGDSSIITVS